MVVYVKLFKHFHEFPLAAADYETLNVQNAQFQASFHFQDKGIVIWPPDLSFPFSLWENICVWPWDHMNDSIESIFLEKLLSCIWGAVET